MADSKTITWLKDNVLSFSNWLNDNGAWGANTKDRSLAGYLYVHVGRYIAP